MIHCDRCMQPATETTGTNNYCFPCLQDVLKLKNDKSLKFLNISKKKVLDEKRKGSR